MLFAGPSSRDFELSVGLTVEFYIRCFPGCSALLLSAFNVFT